MAEETVVAETTVTETTETPFFGNDGALADGWQGTLDESLREEKSLSTFKTVGDLAKSFVNTKSMVGKNTMVIPDETSSETEWEAYYTAGGRPTTVADYGLKAPEDFPVEVLEQVFPKARLDSWQERFFKAGVSKKAADEFVQSFAQDMIADIQVAKQAEELQMSELVKGLNLDWGAAFEQKKHLGNMAVEEGTGGDAEFKERLTKKFGNDPDFVRFTSNLGGKFAEGKSPNFSTIPTPGDYQEQITKIQEDPLYMKGTTEQRMRLANQVMALREKMTATTTPSTV